LRAFTSSRLDADNVWWFLDGLDEVGEGRRALLGRLLDAMQSWKGRVLLGTRPYGLDACRDDLVRRWPGESPTYRLAPFDRGQSRLFVQRWFGDDPRGKLLQDRIDGSSAVRMLAYSPYLLRQLCGVAARREIPAEATRCDLYGWFLEDWLGCRLARG